MSLLVCLTICLSANAGVSTCTVCSTWFSWLAVGHWVPASVLVRVAVSGGVFWRSPFVCLVLSAPVSVLTVFCAWNAIVACPGPFV